MELNLRDKTAIVTGGASGIGWGIADVLAEEGVRVVMTYCNPERETEAEEVARSMAKRHGVDAAALRVDFTQSGEIDRLVDATVELFGGVDILVNNAGVWPTEPFMDIEPSEWSRVIDICLNGPAMLAQAVARRMIDAGSEGRIVNISSKSAFQYNTAGHSHYATCKAAINMLTRTLARELSPHRIHVTGVAPGMVETPINRDKWEVDGAREKYEKRIPVGRFAQAREIGYLVAFLLSDKAFNITGTTIYATGRLLI